MAIFLVECALNGWMWCLIFMLKINRRYIHVLLVTHPHKTHYDFFSFRSPLRLALERLRGDLVSHELEENKLEHSEWFHADLNQDEQDVFLNVLADYIQSTPCISEMEDTDNLMVHTVMCEGLLAYELDTDGLNDSYRQVIDAYFAKLHKETCAPDQKDLETENSTSLDVWLQHLIDNPELYLNHLLVQDHHNVYSLGQLDLSECGCVDLSHDRLFGNVRVSIEKMVLEYCQKIHAKQPDAPIKLLSFGPGKGLQDFVLVLKLFKMGIRNLELTFIEPEYIHMLEPQEKILYNVQKYWKYGDDIPSEYLQSYQNKLYSIVRALSLLSRSIKETNLTVFQYPSVQHLQTDRRQGGPFDVIYAIDIDDYCETDNHCRDDFNILANNLSEQGRAFLSCHNKIEQFEAEQLEESMRFFRPLLAVEFDGVAQTKWH